MIRTIPLIDASALIEILPELRIFGGMTDSQQAQVFKCLEIWALDRGDSVFTKGEDPSAIYIMKSGRVDLQITEPTVVIRKHTLQVGECFGEASFMSMHAHTTNAVATESSEVIVMSRAALLRIRRENVELFALLMMNLARELARRLYLTDQMMLDVMATRNPVS